MYLLTALSSWRPPLRPTENNQPPVADAGPEKELTLPVDRTTLDGSKSSDDQKISSYLWTRTGSGSDPLLLQRQRFSLF